MTKRNRAEKREKDAQSVTLEGDFLIVKFDRPASAHFKMMRNCSAMQLLAIAGYISELASLEITTEKVAEAQKLMMEEKAKKEGRPQLWVPDGMRRVGQ